MTTAVLGLGANIGDPLAALRGAVTALEQHPDSRVVAVSSLYATDPIGGPEQPRFLNAVVILETELQADQLLDVIHGIEVTWHRTREVRWGPRTLDVDILAFGDTQSVDPHLTLPHPRAHERAFVLVPWLEVQPDAHLPGLGAVAELITGVDTSGVERLDEALI